LEGKIAEVILKLQAFTWRNHWEPKTNATHNVLTSSMDRGV
jgi:hypothetical protein